MDSRLALATIAAEHDLDAAQRRQLFALAGLDQPSARPDATVLKAITLLGAVLCGLGLVFWVAANWDGLGRAHKFILLETLFGAACLGALLRRGARVPLALTGLLAIGGLFAYFGQTYQTGADPWQLFALWAALALPLCLSVRHDALWSAWVLVAMTAISLWMQVARAAPFWDIASDNLGLRLCAWGAAIALTISVALPLRRFSGAGDWSFRLGVLMATMIVAVDGLLFLMGDRYVALGVLALLLLGGAAGALATTRLFDIMGLCTVVLAIDVLLIAAVVRALSHSGRDFEVASMLVIGAVATCLFAASVMVILRLWRARTPRELR